jgi:SAM-dependent methyltransferase
MPFTPLPKTFLEDLRRHRAGLVVDLGCGQGDFGRLLQAEGVRPLGIDRRRPGSGTVADLVADAVDLPLGRHRVDLLVAANLLRQLWPLPGGAAVPERWQDCLAPGGRLYILEDEPVANPAPARNYRDLQDFLARLNPWGRGPLLPLAEFRQACDRCPRPGGRWQVGLQENEWPVDPAPVASLLRTPDGDAAPEAQRILAAIEKTGLSYGTFWWARWIPEADAGCERNAG